MTVVPGGIWNVFHFVEIVDHLIADFDQYFVEDCPHILHSADFVQFEVEVDSEKQKFC